MKMGVSLTQKPERLQKRKRQTVALTEWHILFASLMKLQNDISSQVRNVTRGCGKLSGDMQRRARL